MAANRRPPTRKRDPAKRRDVVHDGRMGEVDTRAGEKGYTTMPDFSPALESRGINLSSSNPSQISAPLLLLDDHELSASQGDEECPSPGRNRSNSSVG